MSPVSEAGALGELRTVRVGTRNPTKLEAVRLALGAYAEGFELIGHSVDSGVPEQPVGFAEVVQGARQRAARAWSQGPCQLAVGIEDGLVELAELGGMALNVGAAVVSNGEREGLGFSSLFAYPEACSTPALADRRPIGDAFDALWRAAKEDRDQEPSGRSIGNIGKLTLGVMPRSEYARHAVLCALIHFLHPELYSSRPLGAEATQPSK
ncbi:MAG: inosine/xanthosine triphosphatase [Myxococcota bacterium]|nr:inosine/xanthosine triphosphatase [Myxococcota bacterium]